MFRRIAPILLLACLAASARAVVVVDLHLAEVEVKDHSTRQLQRAARRGLEQVLIKVSGSRAVLRVDEVRRALADSHSYLQQYQYRNEPDGGLSLLARYDPQLVTSLLASAQTPLWPSNRPPVLVWAVADIGGDRRFVTEGNTPEVVQTLRRDFDLRGVPMVFPLYDLDDAVALSLHDLWELDRPTILAASRRYGVENILVARLNELSDESWMGDWLFLHKGDEAVSSFYGEPLAILSQEGVSLAAETMAERYAVSVDGDGGLRVLVRIDGVRSYSGYRDLVEYLEGVELIEAAHPTRVRGGSMIFALRARAGAEQLQRIIELERRLQPLDLPPAADADPAVQLAYRWVP